MADHSLSSSEVRSDQGALHPSVHGEEEDDGTDLLALAVNELNNTLEQESVYGNKHGAADRQLSPVLERPSQGNVAAAGKNALTSEADVTTSSTGAGKIPTGISTASTTATSSAPSAVTSTASLSAGGAQVAGANAQAQGAAGGSMLQLVQVTMTNGQQQLLLVTAQQLQALQAGGHSELLQSLQQQQQHMQLLLKPSQTANSVGSVVAGTSSLLATTGSSSADSTLSTTATASLSTGMPNHTSAAPVQVAGNSPSTADTLSGANTSAATTNGRKIGAVKRPSANGESSATSPGSPTVGSVNKRRKSNEGAAGTNKVLTAYACFFREIQAEIRRQNPQATFADLSRMISQMWANLPEQSRQVYHAQSEITKEEYDQAMKLQTLPPDMQPEPVNSVASIPSVITPTDETKPVGTLPTRGRPRKEASGEQDSSSSKPKARRRQPKQLTCNFMDCTSNAVASDKRGQHYCSNECAVKHCRVVFDAWVAGHRKGSTV